MKKNTAIIAIACLILIPLSPVASVKGQETMPGAGQQVINYFIDLFNDDWTLGTIYNESMGTGSVQGNTIEGSPSFTPYKRSPLTLINENMSITPIHSPDNSEALIIDLINSANETLLIEQIYINGFLDDLLLTIIAARDRGVNVSVIQDYNGYHEDGSNILEKHGIPVRLLKSNATLNISALVSQHNKGVIVDGKIVLLCSINWSPTSIRNNRETGLIIESAPVASYYTDLFNFDWERAVEYEPSGDGSILVAGTPPTTTPTVFTGKMNVTCLASPDNVFAVVNQSIGNANSSIYASIYTLSSPYLIDTILDRIANGVDVKLLLEGDQVSSYEKNYTLSTLYNTTILGRGGNVAQGKLSSDTFTFQHSKYAIIDNKTLIISSGNWGMASCPPEQSDGDVKGNRDWWFIIHGDGTYSKENDDPSSITLPWWIWLIIGALGAIGGVFIQLKRKGKGINLKKK